MHKVVHSIIIPNFVKSQISKEVLDSWLVYYKRGAWIRQPELDAHRVDYVQFVESVDDALSHYKNQDVDYLLINWFGAFCLNFHNYHQKWIKQIDQLNGSPWLVSCHIINKEKQKKNTNLKDHFYAYPTTAMIHLKEWRRLGCPAWEGSVQTLHKPQPSTENSHDDYTPNKLSPTHQYLKPVESNPGALFFNAALDARIEILNVPKDLRQDIIHTYPESNPEFFNHFMTAFQNLPVIMEENLIKFANLQLRKRNLRHTDFGKEGHFFILNTESLFPKKQEELCKKALLKAELILSPCSLFKSFLLDVFAPVATHHIHFDIFPKNVEWKKKITLSWDGTLKNLKRLIQEMSIADEKVWNPSQEDVIDRQYQILLKILESEQKLSECWKRYQQKNHAFLSANLLLADRPLIESIKKTGCRHAYLAIGDIPAFGTNTIDYGAHRISKLTSEHLGRVMAASPQIYVDIKLPISDEQYFGSGAQTQDRLQLEIEKYSEPILSGALH